MISVVPALDGPSVAEIVPTHWSSTILTPEASTTVWPVFRLVLWKLTDTSDGSGTFYPLGERAHLLADDEPQQALEALRADLIRHTGGPLHDDAAMLLLRYREPVAEAGPGPAGGPEQGDSQAADGGPETAAGGGAA